MLLRIEEHLSFQKGIALAGACTPYHVVTLKQPNNSHGQSLRDYYLCSLLQGVKQI